ncbi:MAG: hypothetical protein ACK4E8_09390 [Lacibacter sp.]
MQQYTGFFSKLHKNAYRLRKTVVRPKNNPIVLACLLHFLQACCCRRNTSESAGCGNCLALGITTSSQLFATRLPQRNDDETEELL